MSTLPNIPGYHVETLLGAGEMGVVFLARRDDNNYKYAIKMLPSGVRASLIELARFRIEAEAYACLKHPCIINIRDVGVVAGCPYLAMDFAENGSLDRYLKLHPECDIEFRVLLIKQIAEALAHAHGRKILHRDLKPANILMTSDCTPKVSDFGLVKFTAPMADISTSCSTISVSALDQQLRQLAMANQSLLPANDYVTDPQELVTNLIETWAEKTGLSTNTFNHVNIHRFVSQAKETRELSGNGPLMNLDGMTRVGTVIGSPLFMAPEQAKGQIDLIGPHTDIYGLGATLYAILTNRPPVSGLNFVDLLMRIATDVPVSPHSIDARISEDLSRVVLKALQKGASERYADMTTFSEDLERVLVGKRPLACIPRGVMNVSGFNRKSFWKNAFNRIFKH